MYDYLDEIGAGTLLIEEEYIDRSFFIDHSEFFSRSYNPPSRETKRIHVFRNEYEKDEIRKGLFQDRNVDTLRELGEDNNYLGFVVKKPLASAPIGRTLLRTYPKKDPSTGSLRFFPTTLESPVHLFGQELTIDSLRYQQQDNAVCACATTAVWVSVHRLGCFFDLDSHPSPAELRTRAGESASGLPRTFPPTGLNYLQMIDLFSEIGLEVDYFELEKATSKEEIYRFLYSYLRLGIPVIGALGLEREDGSSGGHAVTLAGYKIDMNQDMDNLADRITEFYAHDDQIGPFSSSELTKFNYKNKFGEKKVAYIWNNEWMNKESKYDLVELERLLVPIYHKVRLSYHRLTKGLKSFDSFSERKEKSESYEMYIDTILNNKEEVLNKLESGWETREDYPNFETILSRNFPRFMWVVRFHISDNEKEDFLFDATSHEFRKPVLIANYHR